jgi:glycerate 2-kinase
MEIRLPSSPARPLLKKLIGRGLEAVEAHKAVRRAVIRRGDELVIGERRYDLRQYDRVVAVGAGKATAPMARALEQCLGSRLQAGLVVVKYGHAVPTTKIVVEEAGHPIPDRAGHLSASRLHCMVSELRRRDLLVVLLSGGASSLLPAPVKGVTLADKRATTDRLLRCGATIQEINAVRKHLSSLKGGRLAEATRATVVTLILSDVLGDDLSAIASGPTAPDPTTYREAVAILKRYGIWRTVPPRVRQHLLKGQRGLVAETPKPGSAVFRRVQHHLIGSNTIALTAVTRAARGAGLKTLVHSTRLIGEAHPAGTKFGMMARCIVNEAKPLSRPCCVVAGGETTVTVTGKGKGGRAQEFAAAAAKEIEGLDHVWIAAIGTDGTDGPTDVAGAVVDGGTMARARRLGVDLDEALTHNNTYPALKRLRSHITTGPTGTNVNDLYLLLIL